MIIVNGLIVIGVSSNDIMLFHTLDKFSMNRSKMISVSLVIMVEIIIRATAKIKYGAVSFSNGKYLLKNLFISN